MFRREPFHEEAGERVEERVGDALLCGRSIGQRVAYEIISRSNGLTARMRTWSSRTDTISVRRTPRSTAPLQRRPVRRAGGDPRGLAGREEIAGIDRFDFGDAFDRVFDLVQVVRVPIGDQVRPVVQEASGADRRPASHVDLGRGGHIPVRTGRARHGATVNDRGMTTHEHDDIVRRSFRQQVGLFAGDDSPFRRRPESVLSWIEPLDAEMIVLEVACGAAHVSEVAAPLVRQVVGIDLTPELLAIGAERIGAAGLRNVLLQEGNAAALPFVDASFDLVMCRGIGASLADPRRSIAEMARVCRPGGAGRGIGHDHAQLRMSVTRSTPCIAASTRRTGAPSPRAELAADRRGRGRADHLRRRRPP